ISGANNAADGSKEDERQRPVSPLATSGCKGTIFGAGAQGASRGSPTRDRAWARERCRNGGGGVPPAERRAVGQAADGGDGDITAARGRFRRGVREGARSGCRVVSGWLLDTNVLSELRRPRPSRKVVAFVAGEPLDRLYVSTV